MSEHTVPEALVERIRAGRVALVVGAGIGVPSWRELLETMNQRLAEREASDADADIDAAAEAETRAKAKARRVRTASADVSDLLDKGNLERAAGFLARTLGAEMCDELVVSTWATPEPLPAVAKALAKQPFRHIWTTFPGDLIETAMRTESPEGWPEPMVLTYKDASEISPRNRTLVKILGDFSSYVVTPKSLRQALAGAHALREYAREYYLSGTLIFVGFRYDDPDLNALLSRVFGAFELPEHDHFFVGLELGPVLEEELEHEHHLRVIRIDGEGDEQTRLVGFLTALAEACEQAGVGLFQKHPDDDDLEGWLALWQEQPELARDAVDAMAEAARAGGDGERLVDILVGRIEVENAAEVRAGLLRELARVFEREIHDLERALTALTTALREHPADDSALDEAERLASETDGWTELISEVAAIAGEIAAPEVAAGYWTRLGAWYEQHTEHPDYAVAAYRQAIKLADGSVARQLDAYAGIEEVLRKQQRWADLADVLAEHADVETDKERKIEILLALGDLCENQLASTARAVEAYVASADLDDENDDALAALTRLYRRDERWDKLVEVLERRAKLRDASDPGRAAAIRREVAGLRVDKLGDVDGAIARYEAVFQTDESDIDALRALSSLYEQAGRTADYLDTLERLVDASPASEKSTLLMRVAAEVEEREPERARACYQRIIDIESELAGASAAGAAVDNAFRALERLLRKAGAWSDLVSAYERHIAAVEGKAAAAELYCQMASVYRNELADPDSAIVAYASALELQADNRAALTDLAALHQSRGDWRAAVEVLVTHARLAGADAAPLWYQAGVLITDHWQAPVGAEPSSAPAPKPSINWPVQAEAYLEKALELDATHRDAMLALARLHGACARWANALDSLVRAESHTANRLERVDILVRAANLAEHELRDAERALALRQRVLEIDPEHVGAGRRVSERLLADESWQEALPILEMLARKSTGDEERAAAELELGRVHELLLQRDQAIEHYRLAAQADAGNPAIALALMNALYTAAQEAANADRPEKELAERWHEVDTGYRDVLARFRSTLDDAQAADIWHRLGVAARALGANQKALEAFRSALDVVPDDRPTLAAVVSVASALEDHGTVLEAKRALLEHADAAARVSLWTDIGDILRERLHDLDGALAAYGQALELEPESHVLLHRSLEVYTEKNEWDRAIDVLDQLAAHDDQARRRAKYRYTAALIARDKLDDVDIAVDRFDLSLDDDPSDTRAFTAIDELLTQAGDYKKLALAYRRMLERLGPDAEVETLLPMWSRLADIYTDKLHDVESAIAAMEVVAAIEPGNQERREALANLYLEAREDHSREAISELQLLLHKHPDRIELYRALSNLYTQSRQPDKAYCLARALVFLGAANEDETARFEAHRPDSLVVAERRITSELWNAHIVHPDEDRRLSAMFGALVGAIAATTTRTAEDFELREEQRSEVGSEARRVVARVFKYVSDILSLDPEPRLYLCTDDQGIRVLNTREGTTLVPSIVVGQPHASIKDDRMLAFEVGKRLAYLRPERYINYALGGLPELESTYTAILGIAGVRTDKLTGDAAKMAKHLEHTVSGAVLDQVRALAVRMQEMKVENPVARWQAATELTANRVGLLLCNDLELAARLIATDNTAMTTLSAKERLRDLLVYSVSEPYFQMRTHLCLDIERS